MPPPSGLMSAARVAEACYDRYQGIEELPARLRHDIDGLAAHFYSQSPEQFEGVFLSLVPWDELAGEYNAGHAALGDFLVTGVLCAVLSTNFDTLIEQWGGRHKVDMRGALTGQEACEANFSGARSPLLKFHGCMTRNRKQTLWTAGQLADGNINGHIESCTQWMNLNLPGRDLLVVGFWTDWDYLNQVLARAIQVQGFRSVTVVDPLATADLEQKAPQLWGRITGGTNHFEHVSGSGAEALDELRTAFSRLWMRRFYALGKGFVEAGGGNYTELDPPMDGQSLYNCRRDAEGVPYNRAAQLKQPPAYGAETAHFHHLVTKVAGGREGSWYVLGDKRMRIIQSAGQSLNAVKERFNEPPTIVQPDVVVCAGAVDDRLPGRLVESGRGASIVRACRGGSALWMTDAEAKREFGIGAPFATADAGG